MHSFCYNLLQPHSFICGVWISTLAPALLYSGCKQCYREHTGYVRRLRPLWFLPSGLTDRTFAEINSFLRSVSFYRCYFLLLLVAWYVICHLEETLFTISTAVGSRVFFVANELLQRKTIMLLSVQYWIQYILRTVEQYCIISVLHFPYLEKLVRLVNFLT